MRLLELLDDDVVGPRLRRDVIERDANDVRLRSPDQLRRARQQTTAGSNFTRSVYVCFLVLNQLVVCCFDAGGRPC